MEQSLHKKVYINPNFKRTEIDSWPTEPIKTTHFNRHYIEEMPNRVTDARMNQTISNNRKIYVNPNFISCNNATQSKPPNAGYVTTNENVNNIPNRQLLHKSKYSLVQNFQQTFVNKGQANKEINKNNAQKILESYQNTKKITQEVPLSRSRYCIIRRKKRLSVNKEYKNVNNLTELVTDNKNPLPIACSNQLTCYSNLHAVKSFKNKLNLNTPGKNTKIKITKYKIIPVSYLKKNTVTESNNKNKFVASPFKSYLKSNTKLSSSLIICNKNRFKFIKNSTPLKTSTTLSTIHAALITQNKENLLCTGSKLKSSRAARAKFNLNNIPCRLFTKYGKCLRQVQGHCKYLHDRKHVSLCHKFLKGICHDKNCTLSHELTDKKMPTCYFYLKGMCTKESCPYLHVKLSDKTKICQEFVKGYCENGDKCLFRHVNIDKLKKTKKLSSNSLQRSLQSKVTKTKLTKIEKKCTENSDTMKNSEETIEKDDGDCRYYKEFVNDDDSYKTIKPTRVKLGTLPSFIQL